MCIRDRRRPQRVERDGANGGLQRAAPGVAAIDRRPTGVEVAAVVGVHHVGHAAEVARALGSGVPANPVLFIHVNQRGEAAARLVVVVDTCLLYTSDAADERSSVDLGGRRIIKKKKKQRNARRRKAQ